MTNSQEVPKIVDETDPASTAIKYETKYNNQPPSNRNYLRQKYLEDHPYAAGYILPEKKTTRKSISVL